MSELKYALIFILKMLFAILPFFLLCLYSNKVNLEKSERSKQFFMPVIAVIYVIAAMFLTNSINEWLLWLIKMIPEWIIQFGESLWMPEAIGSVFIQLGSFIKNFLDGLNLNFWIFFLSNAVIILVYLIIKKFCIKLMQKFVKPESDLFDGISGRFYDYYPEKDKWCISESYVQTRSLLKIFYYASVILSIVLMLVSSKFYNGGLLKTIFYPVFGVIVVGELYFYLNGFTKREYSNDVLGEDEDAYKIVNYSLLRKFLRSLFNDKLLTENTSINSEFSYDITTDDILRELDQSEDPKVVSFATYYKALNATGFQIDHNYLYSSLDMLNGKSILFNNPFYNDMIPYAFYPMNRKLLQHKKVLIVLGRHSIENDVKQWVENGIGAITNIPYLWNIGVLTEEKQDLDIGIVTRSDVLNIELHNANSEFLSKVGFIVVLEPSKLISTAQIGLNLLVKQCIEEEGSEDIVYCICDKNCDGLVDSMSHILMTSITEVSATNKHLGTSSYMCWESDDDYWHHRIVPNISRYLGVGTELSFAALKNQVSKTRWYGGETFPVTDIKWISKQYYYDLTKYAGMPTDQKEMDERFDTTPNYWSAEISKNNYITVEDESFNMFEILRDFSTRTTEQGFINVISSDYLLKDYMADNASIFETDAKAIPCIVPDYVRTNRNTILKLALMMSTYPVSVEKLSKEMSLVGIKVYDLRKQLWYELYCCYADLADIALLPDDYVSAVEAVSFKSIKTAHGEVDIGLIVSEERFSLKLGRPEVTYSIKNKGFLYSCMSELKSAGYVAEDEKGQKNYLGSELCGHIYQKYLPGQFFTFDGKYYEMQYLTADGQVLVRRAADHINGRPVYRQIRTYQINSVKSSDKIGAQKDIAGLKVTKEYADIEVTTDGYYKMSRYSDFATAQKILFEGEKNGIPSRLYHNKEILRVELPNIDGKLTDNIRYTITVLFNEVFKTIFAENQAYISAVTDDSFADENPESKVLTYSLIGNGYELQKNCIYIIEDSQLDLGLTVAVERNLERIFKIVQDYLSWHMTTLEESLNPPPPPEPPIEFIPEEDDKPKKKGLIPRIIQKIKDSVKNLRDKFKKKPKNADTPEDNTPVIPADDERSVPEDDPVIPADDDTLVPEDATPEKSDEDVPEDGSSDDEIPTDDEISEDDEEPADDEAPEDDEVAEEKETAECESDNAPVKALEAPPAEDITYSTEDERNTVRSFSVNRRAYHERYYMLYGGNSEPATVDLTGTLDYISAIATPHNALRQAREGKRIAELIEATFKPGKPDARYCDFCGAEIYGVEYETLADGRDRCLNCSRTAIKTGEEFRKIFEDVKRNMESFFGIKINVGIRVEMVNAKRLHKRLGKAFIPTPNADGRVLGVAIRDKNGYSLLVENGSPRIASMLTMAHELTHIWQYVNWNDKAIRKKYGKELRLEIYEGMAKWAEIQYAYLINEPAVAKREDLITSYRRDEYGRGFLRYKAQYPFSTGTVITKNTPFMNIEEPLDPQYCGNFRLILPSDDYDPEDDYQIVKPKPPVLPPEPVKGEINRDPDVCYKYCYESLSEDEKKLYDRMLDAFENFAPEITEFDASYTLEQAKKVVSYIQADRSEIYWIRHGIVFNYNTSSEIVSSIDLTYCMTREERDSRHEEIIAAIRPFLESIHDDMSDYEVTLRVYENIIKLVDYDTIGLERQKATKEIHDPAIPDDLRSIYGVFVNKKAVCAGYAMATQFLLNLFGIECIYVTSDTHAWNIVKLEGDYYYLDTTWGDFSNTKKENSFTDEIGYNLFCITSEEAFKLEAHTPADTFRHPECTATKCNYFHRHGLYFESYDYSRIRSIVCECVANDKLSIQFKFATEAEYNKAKTDLWSNGKIVEAIKYANLTPGNRLSQDTTVYLNDKLYILTFCFKKL